MKNVAIIGAGISGTILGSALQSKFSVTIFEKSRGVGGRMSTRRFEDFYFDHGLPCFNSKNSDFLKFLKANGVDQWSGDSYDFDTRKLSKQNFLVANPSMNNLCKILSKDLDVRLSVEVSPLLKQEQNKWLLFDKNLNCLGAFDFVLSTAPISQTRNLFSNFAKEKLPQAIEEKPCFSLMLGFKEKNLTPDWIVAHSNKNPIKSIFVNSSKPQRNSENSCFVAHSSNSWAKENLEKDLSQIEIMLTENFTQLTGIDVGKASYVAAHRWRFSAAVNEKKSEPFFDSDLNLGATGDWVFESDLESIWKGARLLADKI